MSHSTRQAQSPLPEEPGPGTSRLPPTPSSGNLDAPYLASTPVRTSSCSKFDPQASRIVYATYLGGSAAQNLYDLTVDRSGNVYLAGETYARDFPVTAGALESRFPETPAGYAGFITKIDPRRSALVYSSYFRGRVWACAVDAAGAAYLTGSPNSDFAPTPDAFQPTPTYAFLARLDPDGRTMRFGTFLGTPAQTSFPQRMLLDAEGDIVVAGATYARRPGDFPVTSPLQATPGNQINGTCSANDHSFSCSDVFVMKLRPQGGPPLVSALFGGVDDDVLLGMAQDRGGASTYWCGTFPDSLWAAPWPATPPWSGSRREGCRR